MNTALAITSLITAILGFVYAAVRIGEIKGSTEEKMKNMSEAIARAFCEIKEKDNQLDVARTAITKIEIGIEYLIRGFEKLEKKFEEKQEKCKEDAGE